MNEASSILIELEKYSLYIQASWLVGIKIARAHDASGIDNISVYIGQTIPEAETAYCLKCHLSRRPPLKGWEKNTSVNLSKI